MRPGSSANNCPASEGGSEGQVAGALPVVCLPVDPWRDMAIVYFSAMKWQVLFLLSFLLVGRASGQEWRVPIGPFFPSGDPNPFVNPALIVSDHRLTAEMTTLVYRHPQVEGQGGEISFVNASYELPDRGTAIGLSYANLTSTHSIQNMARLNIAQRFRLRKQTLTPGIYVGFKSVRRAGMSTDANTSSANADGNMNAMIFDIGVGITYRYRKLLAGIGLGDWNAGEWEFGPKPTYGRRERVAVATYLHTVIRYDIEIGRHFRIMPVTQFSWTPKFDRYLLDDFVVFGADSLTKVLERVNIGLGIRGSKHGESPFQFHSFVVSHELMFRWFRLGYAVYMPISNTANQSGLMHQITFRLNLFRVTADAVPNASVEQPNGMGGN